MSSGVKDATIVAMVAPTHTAADLALPPLDVRALARRAAVPAALALAAVGALLLAQSRVHAISDAIERGLNVSPGWAAVAVTFECASLAGYVGLLSLVVGRAASRVGVRESAQITLAGAAATRLLPTAGAGGLALAFWALRQAGLRGRAATRTLLAFLVLLYSVFLGAVLLSGSALTFGMVTSHGPLELGAIPAAVAAVGIVSALALAANRRVEPDAGTNDAPDAARQGSRIKVSLQSVGDAVRDALGLVRLGDARLAGAAAYWAFDAAVLWAMLHAFGSPPVLPVVVLAYFVGQVANTLPIPGSVSGGIAGVLVAFGVAPALAIPAVLAYRTIAVWLPTPAAIAAVPALRTTVARWRGESGAQSAGPDTGLCTDLEQAHSALARLRCWSAAFTANR
jgi:putative heme transporter